MKCLRSSQVAGSVRIESPHLCHVGRFYTPNGKFRLPCERVPGTAVARSEFLVPIVGMNLERDAVEPRQRLKISSGKCSLNVRSYLQVAYRVLVRGKWCRRYSIEA